MSRDIKEGRREVNFSTWEQYDERWRARKLKEIATEVQRGDMSPWYYVPLHRDAKLSAADREIIVNWTKQAKQKPPRRFSLWARRWRRYESLIYRGNARSIKNWG